MVDELRHVATDTAAKVSNIISRIAKLEQCDVQLNSRLRPQSDTRVNVNVMQSQVENPEASTSQSGIQEKNPRLRPQNVNNVSNVNYANAMHPQERNPEVSTRPSVAQVNTVKNPYTCDEFIQPRRVFPARRQLSGNPITINNRFQTLSDRVEQPHCVDIPDPPSNQPQMRQQHSPNTNRRRPVVCCSENHLKNFQPIRPGRSSFAQAVNQGRRIFIAADSMTQRIRKKELYSHINGFATIKSFPGVTPNYLHHYILPHLIEHCPDTLLLHVGTNDLTNRDKSASQIAEDILSAGKTAIRFGVNSILLSGLVLRRNGVPLEIKRKNVNAILKENCTLNPSFSYIDNDNITLDDLYEDRVHLVESGSIKLANNFINAINALP
jgi:hypothetical protein